MSNSHELRRLNKQKIAALVFLAIVGLVNLVHTLFNQPDQWLRDLIFLLIAISPGIINKRLYYLGFGGLTSLFALIIVMLYTSMSFPMPFSQIPFFVFGLCWFSLLFAAGTVLMKVGTYSAESGRFRLL